MALRSSTIHVLDDRQATLQLNVENVLAGVDQLVHRANRLQGWGNNAPPDPVLYTVRGFSPSTRSFEYAVNPRFGSTRLTESAYRSPFRITLSARIEVGTPKRHAAFERFLQRAPIERDFSPAPRDSITAWLADEVTDGYIMLSRQRDSLLLTDGQLRTLETLHRSYRARALALWTDAARYILAHREHPDFGAIDELLDAAGVRNWTMQKEEVPRMLEVLSPAQRELAKAILQFVIDSADKYPPPLFRPF